MSNAKTGLWSAIGALLGGAAGAAAGHYAAKTRPTGGSVQQVEDAMVVGGASGAVVGAFVGGALSGEEEPKQLPR